MSLIKEVSVTIPVHSWWWTGVNNTGQFQLAGIFLPVFQHGIIFNFWRMVHGQIDLKLRPCDICKTRYLNSYFGWSLLNPPVVCIAGINTRVMSWCLRNLDNISAECFSRFLNWHFIPLTLPRYLYLMSPCQDWPRNSLVEEAAQTRGLSGLNCEETWLRIRGDHWRHCSVIITHPALLQTAVLLLLLNNMTPSTQGRIFFNSFNS